MLAKSIDPVGDAAAAAAEVPMQQLLEQEGAGAPRAAGAAAQAAAAASSGPRQHRKPVALSDYVTEAPAPPPTAKRSRRKSSLLSDVADAVAGAVPEAAAGPAAAGERLRRLSGSALQLVLNAFEASPNGGITHAAAAAAGDVLAACKGKPPQGARAAKEEREEGLATQQQVRVLERKASKLQEQLSAVQEALRS